MRYRNALISFITIGAALMMGTLVLRLARGTPQAARPEPQGPVLVSSNGLSAQITLGLRDKEPTEWDGQVSLSEGKITRLETGRAEDKVEGGGWKLRSRRLAGPLSPILPVRLFATFDAPPTAKLNVTTKQGQFSFALSQLEYGRQMTFLDGAAAIERVPPAYQLTHQPTEEDFPACTVARDDTVWCAYVAYTHGNPIDMDAVKQGKFDSLVTKGHGDQVRLMKFDGKTWGTPMDVTREASNVWRPTVAVDGNGTVWVIWSQTVTGNWDLYARGYDTKANRWSDVRRVTTATGADINAVATTSRSGVVWIAWQQWDGNHFSIRVQALDKSGGTAHHPAIDAGGGNEWNPAIAADSKGGIYIAFDAYTSGNYNTYLWMLEEKTFPTGKIIPIATSPRFEARPSIAVDKQDRVWIAYEDADPNWGKDYGTRWEGRSGVPFYLDRNIVVRSLRNGQVRQTTVDVGSLLVETMYPPSRRQRLSFPRLAVDDKGKVWLLFRRHPLASGAGERWVSYATYYDGDRWSPQVLLPHSDNLMDNRPALVTMKGSGLLVVYSSDGRTVGTNTSAENNLYAALLNVGDEAKESALIAADASGRDKSVEPVHPNEAEDLRRIGAYRASIGGKTYQLLRGEFHRHTEFSSHRDQDGPFEELWRYSLDVARMDWIGPGDHDNGVGPNGMSLEYTWWLTQKQVDMYHHTPTFVPMYTYERSVIYPSGHRNVMFARPGIRPLPRLGTPQQPEQLFGTSESGAPDVKNLYAYLKHFDGICASHTSATNMGTDWRDSDSQVEPIVEIFQGHRQSYEEPKAPKAAKDAQDSIGGYQPAGFVWEAFAKGYKLGFQVSSDHVSTHISYAIVFAEARTRESILDAFKKRHCYGANDNIIVDVRCGEKMMGDEFVLKSTPKLEINAIGTAPIARVDIVRQIDNARPAYIYAVEPKQQKVQLSWMDNAAKAGALNMYYVRIMQEDGKMAWASPLWIRYEP